MLSNGRRAVAGLSNELKMFKIGRLYTHLEENWFIAENKDHIHQVISWCIETAPNDCSTVGSERVLLHQIQAGSSYLEIVPLPQDRLLDAVNILVWHPVYEIPGSGGVTMIGLL